MSLSCEYCEVERMYLSGAALYPLRPFPVQLCSLDICAGSGGASSCWLPLSTVNPSAFTALHIPEESDGRKEENDGISLEDKEMAREKDKKEEDKASKQTSSRKESTESSENSSPVKDDGLAFGIDRILYGSTKKAPRKPPRPRPVFSPAQRQYLEKFFHTKPYLQKNERTKIAALLSLTEQQVKIWFQNRRVKRKNEMHQHMADGSAPTAHGYLCSQCFPH